MRGGDFWFRMQRNDSTITQKKGCHLIVSIATSFENDQINKKKSQLFSWKSVINIKITKSMLIIDFRETDKTIFSINFEEFNVQHQFFQKFMFHIDFEHVDNIQYQF